MSNQLIKMQPIGVVRSDINNPRQMPFGGRQARVEVFPQYSRGLLRLEKNSHIWLLMWFHQADRNMLSTVPARIDPDLPEYGVFGLRAFNRPNPIALTLVQLEKIVDNTLLVKGLDAIDGTPVLDIKPYYEQDIVFSPVTPYIRPRERRMRLENFYRQALSHHQETCPDFCMGVRMAIIADEYLGQITDPRLKVNVFGSGCLADTIQGLTQARFANPARFTFNDSNGCLSSCLWSKDDFTVTTTAVRSLNEEELWSLSDQDVIQITCYEKGEGADNV